MIAEHELIDRKYLPPLWRNMAKQERIACHRFLSALEIECEETIARLLNNSPENAPTWYKNQVDYWRNVKSALRLARYRLGLKTEDLKRGKDQPV